MDISSIDHCLWDEIIIYLDPVSLNILRCVCTQFSYINIKKQCRIAPMAANCGYLEVVKWLVETGSHLNKKAAVFAAKRGHFDILKWHVEQGGKLDNRVIEAAAKRGDIEIYNWLLTKGCNLTDGVFQGAVGHGHLEFLKQLPLQKKYDESLCTIAIYKGHTDILEWLLDTGAQCESILGYNFVECNIHILEVLHSRGIEISDAMLSNISELDTIKWCESHGYSMSQQILDNIAWKGDIESIKYLIGKEFKLTDILTYRASRSGNFECLQFLVSQGCPLYNYSIGNAASAGSIEMIEWLLTKGCEIDDAVQQYACEQGRLNVLKWLESNGYKLYYDEIFYTAVSCSHIDILDWLDSKGYRYEEDIIKSAVETDNKEILEWLFDNGYTSDDSVYIIKKAIIEECYEILEWCIDRGYKFSEKNITDILDMHMFETIKYAYQRGIPIPEITSDFASLATNFKWLKWSVKHGCPITHEVALNSLDDMEMAKWVLDKGYKPNDEFMESVAEDGMLELLEIILNKGYTIPETVRTIALEFDKQDIVDWYDINC